jgi:hypothetical protein
MALRLLNWLSQNKGKNHLPNWFTIEKVFND